MRQQAGAGGTAGAGGGADGRNVGALIVDASALQSPTTRLRGIGRYVLGWCRSLEAATPGLIGRYLLDPDLPPLPGEAADLVASGRVRYRDAPDAVPPQARAFHTFALLDPAVALQQSWPEDAAGIGAPGRSSRDPAGLARSATVFDLIPAKSPQRELRDAVDRRRYLARLELLRALDQLHVLSSAVAGDLRRLLGVPAERVVVVGAAADARFVPPTSRREASAEARDAVCGLELSYVLYPSGSHPRKNNEATILAWARLPKRLLDTTQLVVTGEMPSSMAHHYRLLTERLSLHQGVVLAGDVDESTYLRLVQGAELVCFPSLAEGFGLPVAEALACRTPVIASDLPPFDELLPACRRFDPTSPAGIAVGITRALLVDGAGRAPASSPAKPAPRATWSDIAKRTSAALGRLLSDAPGLPQAAPGRTRRPRPRLAVVTPLPPSPSGVAAYSYRLVEELHATGAVEIDLFADGPTPGQEGPAGITVEPAATLLVLEALAGRYDHVIYVIGNSHHHLGALGALRRRRGVVLCHDVRLSNLYIAEHGDLPSRLRSLPNAVRSMYGPEIPGDVGLGTVFTPEQQRRFGLLLAREVIESSERYLVSSAAARELALSDVPGRFEDRVRVLPFALEVPPGFAVSATGGGATGGGATGGVPQRNGRRAASSPPGGPAPHDAEEALAVLGTAPLVAHFGIVDPTKQPMRVLEAFARVLAARRAGPAGRRREPPPRLAFVGPVSDALAGDLRARATELGIADAVLLTGAVPALQFRELVERATVAVQPRSQFNGEASAAVGQCLASGVPTVVSDIGWMRELPDAAVVKVPPDATPQALADAVASLLREPARRAALSRAARELAGRQGFAVAAEALLEHLDELRRAP
jgi:glycosyltransferase involved in cell wall biosynthesis